MRFGQCPLGGVEVYFAEDDPRKMHPGFSQITNYKSANRVTARSDASFPEGLNRFFVWFVPGKVLGACADQLTGVFTTIFNQSL